MCALTCIDIYNIYKCTLYTRRHTQHTCLDKIYSNVLVKPVARFMYIGPWVYQSNNNSNNNDNDNTRNDERKAKRCNLPESAFFPNVNYFRFLYYIVFSFLP